MLNALKNNYLLIILATLSYSVFAEEAPTPQTSPDQMQKDLGYYFGYTFGNMLRDGGAEDVDTDRLLQGLQDSLNNVPPNLDPGRREIIFQEIRQRQMDTQEQRRIAQEQAERNAGSTNLAAANAFLESNATKQGILTTPSGLQYEVLQEAPGERARASSRVVVHYEGRLLSGEVFDRSGDTPAEFGLNQVIVGWTEGLQLMSPGDKYRFFLPPDLAYGPGSVGQIPPNSLLVFEVELLEIK